jgi:hypothetical protein
MGLVEIVRELPAPYPSFLPLSTPPPLSPRNGLVHEEEEQGALVVTTEIVREHPNLSLCLRLEGREVVLRPAVEGGKVELVRENLL